MRNDPSERELDAEVPSEAEPACVELVPTASPSHRRPHQRLARSDPGFIAHLIATAAQAPQTRQLRRGSPADAQTAYRARQVACAGKGCQTRRVV